MTTSPGVPHPTERAGVVTILALTIVSALGAVKWSWLSSAGTALVAAAGLYFNLRSHKRATAAEKRVEAAEARAVAAEKRAAEAHAWHLQEREARARALEANGPIREWVERMRAEHGVGVWFPFEGDEYWDLAHAAGREGLAEVDGSFPEIRTGRARIL
jgi:hypothetical protein